MFTEMMIKIRIICIIVRLIHDMCNVPPEVVEFLQKISWHHCWCLSINLFFAITKKPGGVNLSAVYVNIQVKSAILLYFTHTLIVIPI